MIEFKEGREFVGVWFVSDGSQDWMAAIWRELGAAVWHLDYRFRYYRDARVHDSEDRKSWYSAESDDVGGLKDAVDLMSRMMPGRERYFIDMAGLPYDQAAEKILAQEWSHKRPSEHQA